MNDKCYKCGKHAPHAVHVDSGNISSCEDHKLIAATEHYSQLGVHRFARYSQTNGGWTLTAVNGTEQGNGITQLEARIDFMEKLVTA